MADRIPVPVEAKRYLARKAIVETEAWDDLKWGEHAHAFTVAHSRNAAVLDDIFAMLNRALAEGESFETFRKELRGLMEARGWYGRADKGPDDKEYINWRTRLIFHVNMRTAYEAGRYRQQLRGADLRPIWVYISKLAGDNRRQDHVALHNKAFRYDDPFWDRNRPPNGWGCECSVISMSESGAAREGVEILSSDAEGNPPALTDRNGDAVDWTTFTPETWRYNPGREALAPDFNNYTNLDAETRKHIYAAYHRDMNNTRLEEGEFVTMARRAKEPKYRPLSVLFQVGNVEPAQFAALRRHQVPDSKIMCSDSRFRHSIGDKNEKHKVPDELFGALYKTIQNPETVYEEDVTALGKHYRVFHFVKDQQNGKKIKILMHLSNGTALQIITMGYALYDYTGPRYKKIW
jgi:hypothetical protein